MFEHDCLDTCCFGCLICMCFCICTCSMQLSMFHMERRSRNTLIIFFSSSFYSSDFPAISLGFTFFFFFIFFFCVSSYISGVQLLLLLRSKLYVWGSPFFNYCIPRYMSGIHHSSSFTFPAIYTSGVHLLLHLCSPPR